MQSRRDFLRLAATATGVAMVPGSIRKALAIPAHRATGTIKDVEHIVILMQENRSFDHYFGTMRGVRGFGDPRPALLPNGKTVWHQPTASVKTHHYHDRGLSPDAEHVLPFYINPKRTTEFQAGTDHGWSSGHLAWNNGHYDNWVTQKQDVMTMGYLKREDVAFHYALADAFTICDAYHCSVHANTAPNRIYLWSGTMDARNILGKKRNGPGFGERDKKNGYTWTTYPERLEAHGVSWKLYQGGTGEPGTPTDNYTDNSLDFFANYQVGEGADPNGPLVTKGVTDRSLAGFRDDVAQGRLAQVTWVVAPYQYSEHPEASPRDGAYYINLVLEALTANPEVWSRTTLLIDYDENDGLFDHVIPPMPPLTQQLNAQGLVSDDLIASIADECINMDNHPHERRPLVPGADPGGLQPIGLGPRVPMIVVSPWSTGGYVCSEVFDHTSVLRFLEARFDIPETNITAWRRSLCGDLTSCFDFAGAPNPEIKKFPVPAVLVSDHQPYSVPAVQLMPRQEPGSRPARALPYAFTTHCRVDTAAAKLWLDLNNSGKAGAAFYVRNNILPQLPPRRYTVSAGKSVLDYWDLSANRDDRKAPLQDAPDYDLALHGPNGSFSHFRGVVPAHGQAAVEVAVVPDTATGNVTLRLTNSGASPAAVQIANAYAPSEPAHKLTVAAGATVEDSWNLSASSRWFDLSVTAEASSLYLRRFAAHVETGRPAVSDPALLTEEA